MILNYLSFVLTGSFMGLWLLRGEKFDRIFVYGISPILQAIPAIVIKWVKRVSLTIWVQDLWPQSLAVTGFVKNGCVLTLVGRLTRWIYSQADLLLVQSKSFVSEVSAMSGGVPVLYHPNPGDRATESAGRHKLQPGFNVVFAGNVGSAQSPSTLLEAARALLGQSDIRLVVVGSGSRLNWLRERAEELRLSNIEFAGRFPVAEMPAIFAQASALLVILGKQSVLSQTVPSKIPSYLSAGKPIIGSINGEGASVIREAGAGIVVGAEDPAALAAAIVAVRDVDDATRKRWGESGKRYFDENFDPQILALRLSSLLRNARRRG